MPVQSVEEYLSNIPEPGRTTLTTLIDHLLGLDSRFEVTLAWNVPQIRMGKQYVFGMSAAQKHLTLAPWGSRALDELRPSMTNYVVNKGTFRVPLDWDIDESLIASMVAERLAELD